MFVVAVVRVERFVCEKHTSQFKLACEHDFENDLEATTVAAYHCCAAAMLALLIAGISALVSTAPPDTTCAPLAQWLERWSYEP